MTDPLVYTAGIMMGLFSAPHCIGMCGGLQAAYGITMQDKGVLAKVALITRLNIGRVISYTGLGVLAGALGVVFSDILSVDTAIMRSVAGLMIVLSGLYISGLWTGLRHVESFISGLLDKLRSSDKRKRAHGISAGLLWGCLPCGLVYTALSIAMTQSNPLTAALFMLCFGLGTMPVMIGVGVMSIEFSGWLKNRWIRGGSGILLVCYGLWTLIAPWQI